MLRIAALMIPLLLALAAPPALAEASGALAPADEIRSTLRERGYRIIEDERTWLGRQRVVAEKNGARREVVFNPGTGEILRDYSVRLGESESAGGAPSRGGVAGGVASPADGTPSLSVGDSVGGRVGEGPTSAAAGVVE
jgi:hypothetical protein